MSSGELILVDPRELKFPFLLQRQTTCSATLTNRTQHCVVFKIKSTNSKDYWARPSVGVISPGSTCNVLFIIQKRQEFPPAIQCRDKFILQSVITGSFTENIRPEMFDKGSGNFVDEYVLKVRFVAPLPPPSPSWEKASAFSIVKTEYMKLALEKTYAIEEKNKLHQELELLRKEAKHSGRSSLIKLMLAVLLGFFLGFVAKTWHEIGSRLSETSPPLFSNLTCKLSESYFPSIPNSAFKFLDN